MSIKEVREKQNKIRERETEVFDNDGDGKNILDIIKDLKRYLKIK